MILGKFTMDEEGTYYGTIKAYGMPATDVVFKPQVSQKGTQYYTIIGDPNGNEFDGGAAFIRQSGDMQYLSVALESPVFHTAVNAKLFASKDNLGTYNLVWDRPENRPAPALTANVGQGATPPVTTPAAATVVETQSKEQKKKPMFRRPGMNP